MNSTANGCRRTQPGVDGVCRCICGSARDQAVLLIAILTVVLVTPWAMGATVKVTPSRDLASVIRRARNNTTIELSAGTFTLVPQKPLDQGATIENKSNLTIRGQGWDKTTIRLAADVKIGLYIAGNVRNLKIENLKIEGSPPLAVNTNAIGSYTTAKNIRKVRLTGLRIENVATAISIGEAYKDVQIIGNILTNMLGTESGWGYGIANSNAKDALIAGNLIENAARHAIYQGRGARGAKTRIEHNLILDQNRDGEQPRPYCAALVCARSSSVRLAGNIVVNPRAFAISVEPDDVRGWPTDNIFLLNNKVVAGQYVGIWVITRRTHVALGNTIGLHPDPPNPNWSHKVSSFHFATGKPTDSGLTPPKPNWADPDHVAELNGRVYVMKDGVLDEVTPYTWTSRTSPKQWSGVVGMAGLDAGGAAGSDGGGLLYIVTKTGIQEVAPGDWKVTAQQSGDWVGAQFIAATSGYLFVLRNNTLYRLTAGTLEVLQSPRDWSDTLGMFSWGGHLHLFKEDRLYTLRPDSLAESDLAAAVGKQAAAPAVISKKAPAKPLRKNIDRALGMGKIYEQNKQFDLARKSYLKLLARYPDGPEADIIKARLKALDERTQ